ncbi:hypothetical protein LXL04_021541 [Taraxacum kok-saghyz]
MIKGLPEIAGVLWKQRIQSTSSLFLSSNPSAARQRERYEGDRRADAIARQRERYEGDRRAPGRSRRPFPPRNEFIEMQNQSRSVHQSAFPIIAYESSAESIPKSMEGNRGLISHIRQ